MAVKLSGIQFTLMKLYYKIKKDPTVNGKKKTGPGNKSLRMESS